MPTPSESAKSGEISPPSCQLYEGSSRDPSLLGTPAGGTARCCENDFGLDVELVLQSCGLSRYLGQSEELACVHRFADAEGGEHELRLSPVVDLSLDAAAQLHASSGSSALLDTPPVPGSSAQLRWLPRTHTRNWVLVEGWSALRRVSWSPQTCAPEAMLPVLEHMLSAPPAALSPLPRLSFAASASERADASLLSAGAEMHASVGPHALPHAAADIAAGLLHAAATSDVEAFAAYFEPDARWGLPDRRQLSGRSLQAAPEAALEAFARSAARLPADTQLHCPALDRRVLTSVERGEATMWCLWMAPEQLDLIVLALRGRVVEGRGDARVAYLGMFPDAPLAPVALPGEPPPPPAVPTPHINCGDPHAIEYPGLCPELTPELDEDELDADELDAHALDAHALDAHERRPEQPMEAPAADEAQPRARRGEVLRLPPLAPLD